MTASVARRERWLVPIVAAIVLAAVVQAALLRAHNDLSVDEPFMASAIAHPESLPATFVHDNHPLAYLLLIAWARLFGSSAFALRALSMVAYAGAIAFSAAAARHSGSITTAWLTALLIGCSVPIGLEHAATARPYGLLVLFAAMALWASIRVDRAASRVRAAFPIAAAHLLGLFTHPIFVFASLASALAGALCGRKRLLLAGAPIVAIAVYLVSWWHVLKQSLALPATSWMRRPGADDLVAGYTALWGNRNGFVFAGIVLALVCLRGLAARRVLTRDVGFAALTVLFVFGSAFVASQMTPAYLAARTPMLVLPAASMAFAALVSELGTPALTGIVALLVMTASLRYTVEGWRRPDPAPTRASLAAVAARASCGDTIVATGLSYAPLAYIAPRANVPSCVTVRVFPDDVRDHPGWLDMSPGYQARLDAAAPAVASSLPRTGTLWVFVKRRGIGAEAGDAIVRQIAARRALRETLPLRGTFFDEVQVFGPAP
ncbi:MAG: hypothetical protein DMF85_15645 [Acidobacteria bacterium]|nr:MAG: hypothetical protein DMF85_15645 [Acidobacteriota bacterium]